MEQFAPTQENVTYWLQLYQNIGPLAAVFMTFVESFFPILPLSAIVVANSAAFGLVTGFLYSLIGSILGSFLLYLLAYRFGTFAFFRKYEKHALYQKTATLLRTKGAVIMTLLYLLPVFPNILVTIVSGLTKMNWKTSLLTIAVGKFGFFLLFGSIGGNLSLYYQHPLLLLVVIAIIALLTLLSKWVEKKVLNS